MSFLSSSATQGRTRNSYAIEEDRIIVNGLEDNKSAAEIVTNLAGAGFHRSLLSVRYRVTVLRAASEKFDSLELFHAKNQ
jgi:hypothetical protein